MDPMLDIADRLSPEFEEIEIIANDGRHGIGLPWVVMRGLTRSVPPPRPGTVFIGEPVARRFRRLYVHPYGYVIEGGRGGARIFDVELFMPPLPYSPVATGRTLIRARSIRLAVAIVEALVNRPSA